MKRLSKMVRGAKSTKRREYRDRLAAATLTSLLILHFLVSIATYFRVVTHEFLPRAPPLTASRDASKENNRSDRSLDEDAIRQLQQTFPIHVNEWTEVPHPGVQAREANSASLRVSSWPSDLPKTMQVPQFFDESHGAMYGGSIRQFLGRGGQRLMTPEEAASVGSRITTTTTATNNNDEEISTTTLLETVFCSIASYRDYECTTTVIDVLERAEHPERLRIAIIDQRLPEDPICGKPSTPCNVDPNQTLCRYQHLIDRTQVDARLACGPVFARHLAQRHYRGEYYAMQIDAHVRFVEHWDTDLVNMWKSAQNEMAVLTLYLSDIDGIDQETHTSLKKGRAVMCQSDFEGKDVRRHLRHGKQPERPPAIHGEPMLQPYWAAGFSFARGHFLIQVPYDQHLPMVFQGEEISIGLRGFTYGYDYYTPEHSVCFHIYAVREHREARRKVPKFSENSRYYAGIGLESMKRLNTIIGMENYPRDDWNTVEEDKYGLGHVRDPNTFFDTFGIHVEEHRVEKNLCLFVGLLMMKRFRPALRSNRMGLDYDKIQYRYVARDAKDTIPRFMQ